MSASGTVVSPSDSACEVSGASGASPIAPSHMTAWRHSRTVRTTGPSRSAAAGRGAAPVGTPHAVCALGKPEPPAVIEITQLKAGAAGERVIGAQDDTDRVRAQHADVDPGAVKRRPGQRHVDQPGPQACGRVGEVGFADMDAYPRVALAEGAREAGARLLGAVGEDPDREGGRSRRGRDPVPGAVGLLQQGARLVVQRGSGGGEGDPSGGAVQQEGAEVGLQLLDGAAQRRLGHVQARRGAPEMAFFRDRHEVTEQAKVHQQPRYRHGIGHTEQVLDGAAGHGWTGINSR